MTTEKKLNRQKQTLTKANISDAKKFHVFCEIKQHFYDQQA